jgi:hypothetical protein
MKGKLTKCAILALSIAGIAAVLSREVGAVPSFQRQTGMACTTCHTVFPDLTPFGRSFKLGGYLQTKPGQSVFPPLAAMIQGSFTEQRGLSNRVDPFDDSPDAKWNAPQQASLFYGGKIVDHIGAFSQLTYDGVENELFLDNTDVRYANGTRLGNTTLIYGLTLNNNPTVQDVWNSTPAWGFPSASSAVATTPSASPVIDGVLAQQVGGIGAYGFWNNLVYGEVSVYRSNNKGITLPLGAGTSVSPVTNNTVPYWRFALQHQWNEQSLAVGAYGIVANIYPGDETSGSTDRFTDTAVDAQYQFIGKKHVLSIQGTYIHERQKWNASYALGDAANQSDTLNVLRTNVNYWYRSSIGTLGGTVGYFSTTGSKDSGLYAPEEQTGSLTGSPDSRGFLFQADYEPWEKWKVSLQYTYYDKFNGGHSNYDGFGTDATDNNTFYAVLWILF